MLAWRRRGGGSEGWYDIEKKHRKKITELRFCLRIMLRSSILFFPVPEVMSVPLYDSMA